MKKVVLATLSQGEVDAFYDAKCYYETLLSLKQNQYITENEKKALDDAINFAKDSYFSFYEKFITQYHLPHFDGLNFQISQDTKELFVMLP